MKNIYIPEPRYASESFDVYLVGYCLRILFSIEPAPEEAPKEMSKQDEHAEPVELAVIRGISDKAAMDIVDILWDSDFFIHGREV